MMKKRNVAVAMAAVTVASTVAPAFANTIAEENKHVVSNESSAKLISEVRNLLRVKYTDTQKNVYSITAKYDITTDGSTKAATPVEITSSTQLAEIIEDTKNSNIVLTIVDKGHAKDGEKIVSKAIRTYKDNVAVAKLATDVDAIKATSSVPAGVLEAKYDANKAQTTIKIGATLEDGVVVSREFIVNVGDSEIEFGTAENDLKIDVVDADKETTVADFLAAFRKKSDDFMTLLNGSFSDKDENEKFISVLEPIANAEADKLELTTEQRKGFETLVEGENGLKSLVKKAKVDLTQTAPLNEIKTLLTTDNNKNLKVVNLVGSTQELNKIEGLHKKGLQTIVPITYEVTLSDAKIETVKSDVLFDGLMLTNEGKELVDALENGIEKDGKLFKVSQETDSHTITKLAKDSYELVMNFKGEYNDPTTITTTSETFKFQVKVTGKTYSELEKIANIFTIVKPGKVEGANANAIIGARRTDTAVEISKENFKPATKNGSVVLVGANAVVDGLAAGPLAKLVNAPVLLTSADSLDASVEKEIKRLLVDDTTTSNLPTQTVYIVGGESVVSEKVVEQLEKLGVKVERLAGDRRDTTSLAVAEKMAEKKAKFEKAFVVGAKGEADAMSIAAHAAKEEAPIIVTALDGSLSKDAKKLIAKKQIDVIGGETAVTKELEEELKTIDKDEKITRVKGKDRFETNANVIRKYHTRAEHVYFAKDGQKEGNDKLVDALAISPVAAKNNGVVALATNDLTEAQQEALELRASTAEKMTQVGGGVSETVVTKIAKMLGLKK